MGEHSHKGHSDTQTIREGAGNRKARYLVLVLAAGILAVSLKLTGFSFGTYTVRFYDDVSMSKSGLLSTQRVPKGSDAEPPRVPEREGMKFVEWSANYTNVQRDLDIYARWAYDGHDAATNSSVVDDTDVYEEPGGDSIESASPSLDDDSTDEPSVESDDDKAQDEEWAPEPNYAYLDYTYRELTIEDIDGLDREGRTSWGGTTGRYWATDVRASCYVDRILRADDNGTIALYVKANVVDESRSRGFDTTYFAVCGPESMFDEVNLGSNITFYGSSGVIGSYKHLNTHWLIFEADYVRVDSRDLEQYVKPNNVDPRK